MVNLIQLNPEWDFLTIEDTRIMSSCFYFDSLPTVLPLVPQIVPDKLDKIFDSITYNKGKFLFYR
jgi:aminopeptidase N